MAAAPSAHSAPCDRPVNPPRCNSVGNDIWHFVYIDESVPPALAAALRRTVRQDYDRTYLRARVQRRITSATDAIAYAADHGENGAAGWVYCPPDAPQGRTVQGDRWCQRQEIHFNLNERYAAFFADRASRDYMACHELGHTIGLLHWGNPPASDGAGRAHLHDAGQPGRADRPARPRSRAHQPVLRRSRDPGDGSCGHSSGTRTAARATSRGGPQRPVEPLVTERRQIRLVTRGRRSGQPRMVTLYAWPDAENLVIVGSAGGRATPSGLGSQPARHRRRRGPGRKAAMGGARPRGDGQGA